MIFIIVLIFSFLSLSVFFLKRQREENKMALALARAERKKQIKFFCQRAREMSDKGIGEYQVWWGRNHESDVALKKYYIY